jgi:hypothetical protein
MTLVLPSWKELSVNPERMSFDGLTLLRHLAYNDLDCFRLELSYQEKTAILEHLVSPLPSNSSDPCLQPAQLTVYPLLAERSFVRCGNHPTLLDMADDACNATR